MLASGFRLVFDSWSGAQAELCKSAYETLLRLSPTELHPYQRIVYAHILMLNGKYAEALDLCDRSVSEASSLGAGQVMNFLAHFGALSANLIIFLRIGQFGKVLQITKAGRTSPDQNLSLYWLLTLREAMLRANVFDFEGARQICRAARNARGGEFPDAQYLAIDEIAAGNIALQQGKHSEAVEHFTRIQDLDEHTKFFMHWEWRMTAQLELSNAWLLSENVAKARTAADGVLKSALATSDPHLQALAWDLQARVALAENDLQGARASIERAFAIIDCSEVQGAAWQVYATAWQLYQSVKEHKTAETNRERAETCILKIANSFLSDEPLRATFLAASPVRRILCEKVVNKAKRQQGLRRVAAP
jgi:tetratricopeptide (TPR) repeat protein